MASASQGTLRGVRVGESSDLLVHVCVIPASAALSTVNPSLQTFRWVNVTMSARPCRVNSSLHKMIVD